MSDIVKLLLITLLSFITLTAHAKNTILILGDSLSAAHGIQLDSSWPKLLEKRIAAKKLNYSVVNASQSGDTTSNGLSRLPLLLKKHDPSVVIIALGANDALQGKQPGLIEANLQKMIDLVFGAKAVPILIGIRLPPNYGADYASQFVSVYNELAEKNDIKLVPSLLQGVDDDVKNFQADRLHPVAAVQPAMMNNVWIVLEPLLKTK